MKKVKGNTVNNIDNEKFLELLKEGGYKITHGRISILEIFSKYHAPLNVEFISKHIKKPKLDAATIYRTLKSFEEKGILKRVDLRGDTTYFELNDHHHHHLICKKCGDIEDVEICEINKLSEKVLKYSLKFKTISEHSLEFFGFCVKCQRG